jgi:16S rRNA processing protein RimM
LLGLRGHGEQAIIRLAGVDSPEEGKQLRGTPLRIAGVDAKPAEPGEFFLYQVIGLTAYDETGAEIGRVTDLIETGAHDVFVISPATGPDLLFPNHPDFVPAIDPEHGRMVVRPLVFDEGSGQRPAESPKT